MILKEVQHQPVARVTLKKVTQDQSDARVYSTPKKENVYSNSHFWLTWKGDKETQYKLLSKNLQFPEVHSRTVYRYASGFGMAIR